MSENIRVTSVIGRFLEHSRIFHFGAGHEDPLEGEYYIGSADWMYRNLNNRVEAITPIEGRILRERLWAHLAIILGDQRQAWDMQPDGRYVLRYPTEPEAQPGTQQTMMRETLVRCRGEGRGR
jgi:polyphosphate kinase